MKKRSKHSLSFQRLQSMNMGYLYPTGVVEVLPGDSMRFAQSAFCRFSPLVNPVMAKINIMMYRFFVPYRLLDSNFETMITGGASNDTSVIAPQIALNGTTWKEGGIFDYLGIGNPGSNTISINAYAARAYNMIWNEFFRDQDLMTEAYFDPDATTDDPASYGILPVAWEKDYFTIARPWMQKGSAVSIPVQGAASGNMPFSGSVSVTGTGTLRHLSMTHGQQDMLWAAAAPGAVNVASKANIAGYSPISDVTASGTASGSIKMTATGFISPEDLRLAMSLQRFAENRARFGSRYSEYLRMLGVRPQDMRLDLPEYLGGGLSTMQLSEVIQTSDGQNPLGTMAGHGVGVARSRRSRHFFPEHGLVIFLAALRPKALYTNSIPREFLRKSRFDFWQPELQHLGQQEITNKELNASNNQPDGVFGYSDRYNEYRYKQSQVCGEFRSLLSDWHLGRILPNNTTLNADFVRCQPRTDIFSVTDANYDKVYCSFSHSIQARRMITRHASPSLR
ncbi:major capsid protein [Dipodfec virus RodF1_85]|uniref:Major capsid protein n=1 Tax=Dipodfec virus RodF1_85 TaxID=2929314 RepID=A0A976R7G0_9VIRU|nr:major capsid protein [Dipodfec virus RodF1_85]